MSKMLTAARLADAVPALARTLLKLGKVIRHEDMDWCKMFMPLEIGVVDPTALCPRYLSLGDPFSLLLTSFASLFPQSESSRFPSRLMPTSTLDEHASPSAFAAQVTAQGRCVIMAGSVLATFELEGVPGDHAVLNMNMVCSTGDVFSALAPGAIRWGFLLQAIAAIGEFMVGEQRIFILSPVAPKAVCESVLAEHEEFDGGPLYLENETALGILGGAPTEWLEDARMFVDEHAMGIGYRDRSIKRLLAPAMAAYLKLTDPDSARPRLDALAALNSVGDPAWRRLLSRFANMQRV